MYYNEQFYVNLLLHWSRASWETFMKKFWWVGLISSMVQCYAHIPLIRTRCS